MALLKDMGDNYTRTGKNWFMRASNAMSYIPFLGGPNGIVNGFAFLMGAIGTGLDTLKWLVRGKFSSALTAATTGTVATMTNTALAGTGMGAALNVGSYVATGKSVSSHTRKLSEVGVNGVTGIVGIKPQVLRSYTAGIGSIGGAAGQAGPGNFASKISAERGQDANQAYANYMKGEGGVHVNELQSANYRGA